MIVPVISSKNVGSGQPLVLLHAFPLSHLIWKDVQLRSGFRLIFPDFPGFGLSPMSTAGLNLAQAAMGLKKHLEESGIKEPIVLGGISMGGYWAMEFVRQFPENVKKLILISTKAGVDKPEALQKRLDMADKVEKEGTEFLVQAMVPSLLGKTTHEQKKDVVQILVQWIRGTKPQAVALAQRAMANRRDQRDFLPKITHPTLVLAGAEDTLIPVSEAESMAKTIFESHLEILDHVGHLVPLENPIQFQKIVNEFLAK